MKNGARSYIIATQTEGLIGENNSWKKFISTQAAGILIVLQCLMITFYGLWFKIP